MASWIWSKRKKKKQGKMFRVENGLEKGGEEDGEGGTWNCSPPWSLHPMPGLHPVPLAAPGGAGKGAESSPGNSWCSHGTEEVLRGTSQARGGGSVGGWDQLRARMIRGRESSLKLLLGERAFLGWFGSAWPLCPRGRQSLAGVRGCPWRVSGSLFGDSSAR